MGAKDYTLLISSAPGLAYEYRMKDWAVRSVAGLPLGQVNTIANDPASNIVIFRDYYPTHHTKASKDLYELEHGETGDYYSNYGYLDGHAEGKQYKDFAEYIGQMHKPIRQRWWGMDFATTFADQYK
jgi:prepilin-type processing-associated H-X9-DG protein